MNEELRKFADAKRKQLINYTPFDVCEFLEKIDLKMHVPEFGTKLIIQKSKWSQERDS